MVRDEEDWYPHRNDKYYHLTFQCVSERHIDFKGQLQRFHKLSLFDKFRHVENGFDINFLKFVFVFLL